jgi:hypothetical protein
MPSLFHRFTSYKPSHSRNPHEDMLTEAFAARLEADTELARRIANGWAAGEHDGHHSTDESLRSRSSLPS